MKWVSLIEWMLVKLTQVEYFIQKTAVPAKYHILYVLIAKYLLILEP